MAQASLALLDRDGIARFSLRRLADYLGVTPMALYNHVDSKGDLLQAVAEMILAEADYQPTSDDWRDMLRGCFRTLRATCLAHPSAAPLIQSADVLPSDVFRPMEIVVSALRSAGMNPVDAAHTYFVLMTFTLGQVRQQVKGWSHGVDPSAALREGRIDEGGFPSVTAAVAAEQLDLNEIFELGLNLILAGIESQLGMVQTAQPRLRLSDSPTTPGA